MKLQEYSYQAPLMGTELDVVFVAEQPYEVLFNTLLTYGQACETQFSRFKPDSELSQLNQTKTATLSPLFWEVFVVAQHLYNVSGGVFNPLLSPQSLGYRADFKTQHQNFVAETGLFDADFLAIKTTPHTRKITLQPNQQLDLGGFLKGYVAQRMSKMTADLPGSLINLGGDIYLQGRDKETEKFNLVIDNPVRPSQPIAVSLKNQALATSGTYNRHWVDKHHIVDGRTKDSSQSDLISASVIGPDGAQADALATVAIVLGTAKAINLLENLGLTYVLINQAGQPFHNLKT